MSSLIYTAPGETRDVVLSPGPGTGLSASLHVTLMRVVVGGSDVAATTRTNVGIAEDPSGSNIYVVPITFPTTPGDYYPLWDDGTRVVRDDDFYRVTYAAAPPGTIGAPYFTTAELHARYSETSDFDDSAVAEARAEAEETIEGLGANDGAHVAFVPRTEVFTFSGTGAQRLSIPRYYVREVTDCLVGGEVVDLTTVKLSGGSVFYRSWPQGNDNVVLTVTHGRDTPPRRIKSAAMLLTKELLITGPIDSRASQVETSSGGTITLALPGRAGYVTGIPEVDAAIAQFGKPPIRHASLNLGDSGNLFQG